MSIINRFFNTNELNDEQKEIINTLEDLDQQHLFEDWSEAGKEIKKKKKFIEQISQINHNYPGGINNYIANAKKLLKESAQNINAFDNYTPYSPDIIDISQFNDTFYQMEHLGFDNIDKLAICLVAGGLGERLGYQGIKIDITLDLVSGKSYLAHYCHFILGLQEQFKRQYHQKIEIPFIVMTSPDTDKATRKSFSQANYFGLNKKQITILQQKLVPALMNSQAHIAKESTYSITCKPHGHGDIHLLIASNEIAQKLLEKRKTHLAFIQDTNAQISNALLPFFGISIKEKFNFNSICVPRVPGEPVGAIAKLIHNEKKKKITVNIEYNQLDSLLKATVNPLGDIPNEKGLSVFPGNINVLMLKLESYLKVLNKNKGIVAEFVNPKYNDENKIQFKKPTRLETMMQDLPKLFDANEKVGVTVFDRKYVFSANKNNRTDAAQKALSNQPPECAISAESDYFAIQAQKIKRANNNIDKGNDFHYLGVPYENYPKIRIESSFACTQTQINQKIKNCHFEKETYLWLNGEDIYLENIRLPKGSGLEIHLCEGAYFSLKNRILQNEGFQFYTYDENELKKENIPPYIKIRGYNFFKKYPLIIDIRETGKFTLDENDCLIKI